MASAVLEPFVAQVPALAMALRYRFTFIDDAPVPAVPRFHSCPVRQRDPDLEEQALSWQAGRATLQVAVAMFVALV